MYKYKWNGNEVDTLEYVAYQKNENGDKTGKIIVSDRRFSFETRKFSKVLNRIPIEYEYIYGFEWFTGDL